MGSVLFLVLTAAMPAEAVHSCDTVTSLPAESLVTTADERGLHLVPGLRERSKKERWFRDKALRPAVHLLDTDLLPKRSRPEAPPKPSNSPTLQAELRLGEPMPPIGARVQVVTTLYNLWNREALPLLVGQPYKRRFQHFLRDHYTKQSTQADTRLAGVLAAAAIRFRAPRIEVVSGYRSPKYNLVLRKKGHQVARESQHVQGTAVDFRIYGVTTEALGEFVRSLRVGGVGYYPRTRFIHADTGKVRYWQGS